MDFINLTFAFGMLIIGFAGIIICEHWVKSLTNNNNNNNERSWKDD